MTERVNKKKEAFGRFGLPLDVKYCSKCTTSNQRPNTSVEFKNSKDQKKSFISFKGGICDACRYAKIKDKEIDWTERELQLKDLLNQHRSPKGEYDVVVPGSGGKDSIATAHLLKYKYGMNPLVVTWPPIIQTDIGRKNFHAWLQSGFSNISLYPNQKVSRILTKLAFENLLHPFQPFTIGQKNLAPKIALQYGIKLIFYGEHEGEYGSPIETTKSSQRKLESFAADISDIGNIYLAGRPVTDIAEEYNLNITDFSEYLPSDINEVNNNNIEFHYLGYFIKWHPQGMYYYAVENTEFKPNDFRTEGSYSKYSSLDDKIDWLHYYARYIKFGQGRTVADTSSEIRNKDITRDEGIKLVKKFDGEIPKIYLKDCLDFMGLTNDMFNEIIDSFRPDHLWEKSSGKWRLKKPIWKEDE